MTRRPEHDPRPGDVLTDDTGTSHRVLRITGAGAVASIAVFADGQEDEEEEVRSLRQWRELWSDTRARQRLATTVIA